MSFCQLSYVQYSLWSFALNESAVDYSNLDKLKCAAVFPVFKGRDKEESLEEAWELEKQLESSGGYGLWLCEGRESLEDPPRSITLGDIEDFNRWFLEQKERNELGGIFIMLM